MRKYYEIAKSQIKVNLAYSAWYWAGTFSSIVYLLIIYYFWHAVYANKTAITGMPLPTMLSYIVIAMTLGQYVAGFGNELAMKIRDGSVAIELMRPYDLLLKLIALDFGSKLTNLVKDTIPLMLIATLFLDVKLPGNAEAGILFLISSVLGVMLGIVLNLVIGVLAFWTVNVWGLEVMKNAIFLFFTGSLLPVTMFPHWLQQISWFLPFQSMVYVPASIYAGTISGLEAYLSIGIQVFWLAAVYLAVRMIWSAAVRKVTIFGG